jgi:hypothetical protein
MFIGRKRELALLNEQYNRRGFDMTVIYGRRRIGKSTLIAEYIREKKAIYYTASSVGHERNLQLLTEAVISVLNPALKGVQFPSLEGLLDFVSDNIPSQKLIFVIDEFPYWAKSNPEILSVFQKYIDTKWLDTDFQFILCGSSLSFMEDQILSEKSPLFGRRSAQIKLDAFDYLEAAEFVPDYSYEEKAICYGLTGGVAKYLDLIDLEISLDDNIKKQFFEPSGYLYDETRNLLTQEFNDITLVSNIIEQIASGQNSLSIIADKVHEKDATVLYSIKKLIRVGLVEKRHCITEETNRKKVQYVLKDNMFKFWYEFIPAATSLIEIGKGSDYYDAIVKPQLHTYMGRVFEEICRHFILSKGTSGFLGSFITETGSWWGTEQLTEPNGNLIRKPADIDVVGLSRSERSMVIGECKFKNDPIDKTVFDTLVRRGNSITKKYTISKYLLFSLNGFTNWFDTVNDDRLMTFTLEDLY